jgi:pyruvate formate lyase activating enzyme
MQIGGFQKFSLIDYPGQVASVIFTRGCNFRCPFCHNSELVEPSLFQERVSGEDVLDFLRKRQGYLDAVVITGGEPTLQTDLFDFMRTLKNMGYLVKLDTNGSNPHVIGQVIKNRLADYIAMDIKSSFDRYSEAAGTKVDTADIKKSISMIIHSGLQHEFRTTMVNPLVFPEDVREIKRLIAGAETYTIQKFTASPKMLKKEMLQFPQYEDEEITALQRKADSVTPAAFTMAA